MKCPLSFHGVKSDDYLFLSGSGLVAFARPPPLPPTLTRLIGHYLVIMFFSRRSRLLLSVMSLLWSCYIRCRINYGY